MHRTHPAATHPAPPTGDVFVLALTAPRADPGRGLSYFNGRTGTWGDYTAATRYDIAPAAHPAHDVTGGTVEAVRPYPLDADGYPHINADGFAARLTFCCAAATSASDGPLYCKSCYYEVDAAFDAAPTVAGAR